MLVIMLQIIVESATPATSIPKAVIKKNVNRILITPPESKIYIGLFVSPIALKTDAQKYGLEGISGLHFHTLCEQNSDDLESTAMEVEKQFGEYLYGMKWINFGGGHHITREDYDIERVMTANRRIQELSLELIK